MTESINRESKGKFIITKAGIQVGFEDYTVETVENGIHIKTYSEMPYQGKPAIQNCELWLDENLNTRKLQVSGETKFGKGDYSFNVDDSEAQFKVDQKAKTLLGKDVQNEQTIIWDSPALVIPSNNSFFPFWYATAKYEYEKKGKQYVACGLLPKALFQMDYLGEETVEHNGGKVVCGRSQITTANGPTAVVWSNREEGFFKFNLPGDAFMVEPA